VWTTHSGQLTVLSAPVRNVCAHPRSTWWRCRLIAMVWHRTDGAHRTRRLHASARRGRGGRNRDRTYDLCDVNAALVPTELCAPARRSVPDAAMIPARPLRPGRQAGRGAGRCARPTLRCAAPRSSEVTSTRSTPSHSWQTTWNASGRRIGRATACRWPQHSHVTMARIPSPTVGAPQRGCRRLLHRALNPSGR
jgi:YD repeat-containing protein